MENGIYHLRLYSGDGEDNGVVVINAGAFNGGSGIYLYRGQLLFEGTNFSGSIEIRKWNLEVPSSLGPFKEVNLPVKGKVVPEERFFVFIGRFVGHHVIHIEAKGFYLTPLAKLLKL